MLTKLVSSDPPALASQSAGITGMRHRAQLNLTSSASLLAPMFWSLEQGLKNWRWLVDPLLSLSKQSQA